MTLVETGSGGSLPRGCTSIPARGHRAVLAAVALDGSSAIALSRAEEMARAFGAELCVVGVVPVRSWIDTVMGPGDTASDIALVGAVQNGIRSWCEAILGHALPRDHVFARRGAVVASILDVADELDAELIVLGNSADEPHHRLRRRTADDVIRRARRPVLVARRPAMSSEVIAATDLTDPAYPALRHAADVGARFHVPVTFLHNIDRADVLEPEDGGLLPSGFLHQYDDMVQRRRTQLVEVAEVLDRSAEAVVMTLDDTKSAILELARLHHADLVVVGTHHRMLFGRVVRRASTAVSIARQAQSSVLVVPLDSDRGRASQPPSRGPARGQEHSTL